MAARVALLERVLRGCVRGLLLVGEEQGPFADPGWWLSQGEEFLPAAPTRFTRDHLLVGQPVRIRVRRDRPCFAFE
jgi:hypothetical protein